MIWAEGSVPGTVIVHGTGWSGAGGVWLYQCGGFPNSEDEFWQNCEHGSGVQVADDPPWTVSFDVPAIVDPEARDPFPPGTVNDFGNGTFDCEAVDAECGIFAIEGDLVDFGNATRAWAGLGFTPKYGPPTIVVTGSMSGLKDGDPITVTSSGHRADPATDATTYLCVDGGPAYPGGCDPVAGSLREIDDTGVYSAQVRLPRFVWDNDPFGHAAWYDCADENGCSVIVGSANNLGSPNSGEIHFLDSDLTQGTNLLSVEKVYVNRYGGINVSGRIDCRRALETWGLDDESVARGYVSWTARQPVGRKGVVTGRYDLPVLSMCSTNDATTPSPYGWTTYPPTTPFPPEPYPPTGDWWVYPDVGGKFVSGNITIEVRFGGGVYGGWWDAENYRLTGASQWNVKAVSVKK